MKFFKIISLFFFTSTYGQSNNEILRFNLRNIAKSDTSYYFSVLKSSKGYTFRFPEQSSTYYRLNDINKMTYDTIIEKRSSVFGPYIFIKNLDKIKFKIKNSKFRDLYNLDNIEFLAPDLFSSSADSYSIKTKLLDSNAILKIEGKNISCYEYLQTVDYHYDQEFRLIYIDKKSLLPYKFQYYTDKKLDTLIKEIYISK